MSNSTQLLQLKTTLTKFRFEFWPNKANRPTENKILNEGANILGYSSWNNLVNDPLLLNNGDLTSHLVKIAKHISNQPGSKMALNIFLICSDLAIMELGKTLPDLWIEEFCEVISQNIAYTETVFKRLYLKSENSEKEISIKKAKKIIKYIFTPNLFKNNYKEFIYAPSFSRRHTNSEPFTMDSYTHVPKLSFIQKLNSFDKKDLILALDIAYHCLIKDWKEKSKLAEFQDDYCRLGFYNESCAILIGLLNQKKINNNYLSMNILKQKSIYKPTRFSHIMQMADSVLLAKEIEDNLLFTERNFHLHLPVERLYIRPAIEGKHTGELESSDRFSTENGFVLLINNLSSFASQHKRSFKLVLHELALSKNKIKHSKWPNNVKFAFSSSEYYYGNLVLIEVENHQKFTSVQYQVFK